MKSCNYCTLRRMKMNAKTHGARIVTRASAFQLGGGNGVDVFEVPAGAELEDCVDEKGNHGPQWKAWFAEVSTGCAC